MHALVNFTVWLDHFKECKVAGVDFSVSREQFCILLFLGDRVRVCYT